LLEEELLQRVQLPVHLVNR